MARKRKSKPTGPRRAQKQRTKDRLAHALDDARTAGIIPMKPEEVLGPERVDPRSQDEQRFPGLDRLAIRNDGQGWSVPEPVKRRVIEKAAEVLYERRVIWDKDGNEIVLPPDRFAEAQASKTLMTADKFQHEVVHPEEAGKAKGGVVVNNQIINTGMEIAELMKKVEAQKQIGRTISQGANDGQVSAEEVDGRSPQGAARQEHDAQEAAGGSVQEGG